MCRGSLTDDETRMLRGDGRKVLSRKSASEYSDRGRASSNRKSHGGAELMDFLNSFHHDCRARIIPCHSLASCSSCRITSGRGMS